MSKIFLVEDDKEIAKNLTLLLHSERFAIIQAFSQSEVFNIITKNKFDLALVDISLADGNGFAVCTEIKQIQDIPIIFLTASGDEASVVTELNMGTDNYITKPFRPHELVVFKKDQIDVNNLINVAIHPLLIPIELHNITIQINVQKGVKILGDLKWL